MCNFASTDEGILNREFDKKNKRADQLQDVGCNNDGTATTDVGVGVVGGFACPTHSLAEESAPGGDGADDGGIVGFVDDGNCIAGTLGSFQKEHVIAGRDLGVELRFAREPDLAPNDEVCAGTHDGFAVFGGAHGEFLDGGVFGNL